MFKWLKCRLREWLAEDDDSCLDCMVFDKGSSHSIRLLVTGSVGLFLRGRMVGSQGEVIRLVGESDAVDKGKFWQLWQRFTEGTDIRWEDGKKFRPERG